MPNPRRPRRARPSALRPCPPRTAPRRTSTRPSASSARPWTASTRPTTRARAGAAATGARSAAPTARPRAAATSAARAAEFGQAVRNPDRLALRLSWHYRGAAGELGHMPILTDGPVCSCGNRGCLETQVSTESLLRRARELGIVTPTAVLEDLRALAANGDQRALDLLHRAGELLGRALAGSVNLLGPERVVVIGEISMLWPYLAASFHRALAAHLLPCVRETRIDIRPWADDLIAVGAAGIVLATPLAAPRQKARSGA